VNGVNYLQFYLLYDSSIEILKERIVKTYLGIGIGPGIGYATAARFAREGYRVILAARNVGKLKALASALTAEGYTTEAVIVDAADPVSVADLVTDVTTRHGVIDVLHYNAANVRQATISTQPLDSFNSDLAVNIGGALAAAHAALPQMQAKRSGTVLFTGGGFGLAPSPDYLSVSIGKAGIRALTLGLFEPNRDAGVHVATVTVATFVSPDSKESGEIADAFWGLHTQAPSEWTAEIIYQG
jgi:short-subunit dehydrogenase